MYTICRFEKAWHVYSISPWCAAFTEDELKVSLNIPASLKLSNLVKCNLLPNIIVYEL
jgi:hypothetical protein